MAFPTSHLSSVRRKQCHLLIESSEEEGARPRARGSRLTGTNWEERGCLLSQHIHTRTRTRTRTRQITTAFRSLPMPRSHEVSCRRSCSQAHQLCTEDFGLQNDSRSTENVTFRKLSRCSCSQMSEQWIPFNTSQLMCLEQGQNKLGAPLAGCRPYDNSRERCLRLSSTAGTESQTKTLDQHNCKIRHRIRAYCCPSQKQHEITAMLTNSATTTNTLSSWTDLRGFCPRLVQRVPTCKRKQRT